MAESKKIAAEEAAAADEFANANNIEPTAEYKDVTSQADSKTNGTEGGANEPLLSESKQVPAELAELQKREVSACSQWRV